MRSPLILLLLAACSSKSTGDSGTVDTGTTAGDADTDTDTDSDTDTDTSTESDEQLIRDAIAGDKAIDDVWKTVAYNSGFPVMTSAGTMLFVNALGKGDWTVAGDFDGWAGEPMTKAAGFYWAEVTVASPEGSEYKFVDGGSAYTADPLARSYTYDGNGEISYVAPPKATWRLDRYPQFDGEGLASRNLEIYVPAGAGPWPVLYMHDGQNLYDPNATFGYWDMQDAVAAEPEPFVIVGIDNTGDRMSEYTETDDSDPAEGVPTTTAEGAQYAKLVAEDIKPFVESKYATNGLNGVLGSSLGGLISLYIGYKYPADFAFVGSMSGTLGWGRYGENGPCIDEIYQSVDVEPFVLYVDSGGDPGSDGVCTDGDGDGFYEDDADDSDNYCVTRQFADDMAAHGYAWEVNLNHWYEAGAQHNEAYWSARVYHPLDIFLALDK